MSQLSNFCDTKGNGTYAASFGHDDLVMAQLQMVFVFENPQYKSLCQMFLATINAIEVNNTYNPYEDINTNDFLNSFQQDQDIYSMQQFNSMQDIYDFQNAQNPYSDTSGSWIKRDSNSNIKRLNGM